MKKKDNRTPKVAPHAKYNSEKHCQAVYFMALGGMTDTQMARELEIARSTFSKWKVDYPEFADAMKGKNVANKELIKSGYKAACGYTYEEVTKERTKMGELRVTKVVTKVVPPNPTLFIYWTHNRLPTIWRNKQEVDHTINDYLNEDMSKASNDDILKELNALRKTVTGKRVKTT